MAEAREVVDSEDWMKIQTETLHLDFYVELENDEAWYTSYTSPDHIFNWQE